MFKSVPFSYSVRSLLVRKLTTFFTVFGLALVVFVFSTVLMLDKGLEETVVSTGERDNLIVTRRGSSSEVQSAITKEQASIISQIKGIASIPEPKVSNETVVLINLKKKKGSTSNVVIRGLKHSGIELRRNFTLDQGSLFREGTNEVIVGRAIAKRFGGLKIGELIKFGGEMWRVVGYFRTNNNGFESEIWTSNDVLMQVFKRNTYSTVLLNLTDVSKGRRIKDIIDKDVRLPLRAKFERSFYEESSAALSKFITILGVTLTVIFSIGATIGAMITMQAAVMNRTTEISTLKALGFSKLQIMITFLFESFVLSLMAGVLGIFLASFFSNVEFSTSNFQSFAELAFKFSMDSSIVLTAFLLALFMGVIGGLIPAFYATKIKITEGLRSV